MPTEHALCYFRQDPRPTSTRDVKERLFRRGILENAFRIHARMYRATAMWSKLTRLAPLIDDCWASQHDRCQR